MEKIIKVKLKRVIDDSYPVIFLPKALDRLGEILARNHRASSYAIICDGTTKKLFGETLHKNLLEKGMKSILLSVPPGEKSKSIRMKTFLEESMLKAGCDRKSLIVALGGGVVGDLAGFVASTYMRGIYYIQVPTTLLAMVDSSIGGKTGIDNSIGKNLVGSFWQPKAVYIDIHFLETLPVSHIKNGLCEAIKVFSTSDLKSFRFIEENVAEILMKNPKVLQKVISRAVSLKASCVSDDEKESSKRMILNLGHTIGHALEKLSGYKLMHGYAVALGMLVEARIAVNAGVLPASHFELLKNTLANIGIKPDEIKKFDFRDIIKSTQGDKKSTYGKVKYVFLEKIGKVKHKNNEYAHVVEDSEVLQALREVTD